MTTPTPQTPPTVLLQPTDISSSGTIACPNAAAQMPQWASHPLVYLQLDDAGQVTCPYCSTMYRLEPNA